MYTSISLINSNLKQSNQIRKIIANYVAIWLKGLPKAIYPSFLKKIKRNFKLIFFSESCTDNIRFHGGGLSKGKYRQAQRQKPSPVCQPAKLLTDKPVRAQNIV